MFCFNLFSLDICYRTLYLINWNAKHYAMIDMWYICNEEWYEVYMNLANYDISAYIKKKTTTSHRILRCWQVKTPTGPSMKPQYIYI